MKREIKQNLITLFLDSQLKTFDDKYFNLDKKDKIIAGYEILSYNKAINDIKKQII